jgi:hypothetical protein
MKRILFVLIFIMSFLIIFSTLNIASESINVNDYIKDKFPLIFNLYLSSLGELDSNEKEFIDLLQNLPQGEQKYYAQAVHTYGFSMELFADVRSMRFGIWDEWQERLPQMDSKYWSWLLPDQKTMPIKYDDKPVVLASCLHYTNVENHKQDILIIFYSHGSKAVNLKKEYISGAEFTLALFPMGENRTEIIVRAYERQNDIFKFMEEWDISFRDKSLDEGADEIVSHDVRFRDIFNDWLWSQELPAQLVSDSRGGFVRIEDLFLPDIRINKEDFFIKFWGYKEIKIW